SDLVQNKTVEQLAQMDVGGVRLKVIPQSEVGDAQYAPYQTLLSAALRDPDGVAVIASGDDYMAAAYNDNNFIVLPMFGRSLSSQALHLLAWIAVAVVLILLANFYSIHRLTRPFIELRRGVRQVDKGDLSYRIPLERTYGEYRTLADSFNHMLERLHHIHEARRHMLLAIPHEVRTPLARLKVRKDLITDEPLRQAILGDINNVERILDAILYTEKTQVGASEITLSQIELERFFTDVVAEYQHSQSPVELHISTHSPLFYGHPVMMLVLMRNLISNALFYSEGKPVSVSVREQEEGLHISVADQGIGIAADQLPFLTEPFWRADHSRQRQSGGYGLGLYICKTIVDGLHGTLKIDSIEGQGTTVLVSFPDAFNPTHLL
ncbi:MAG: sensor histidine kinase, partial [Enterobacteriaceae bacterium]